MVIWLGTLTDGTVVCRQKAYVRWWCDETATGALLARSEPVPDDR